MLCTFLDPTVLGETAQVGLSRHGAQMVLFSRHGICFILNIERVLKELDSSPFMYAVFAAGKITSVGLKKSYIRVFSAACMWQAPHIDCEIDGYAIPAGICRSHQCAVSWMLLELIRVFCLRCGQSNLICWNQMDSA
jgi:hypothetical protein